MKIILLLLFIPIIGFSQSGSEIYLLDLSVKNGQVSVSNPVNISNHKGYDNQPSFHPSKQIVYFSSFNDSGRSDIKLYDITAKKMGNLTRTNDREYSPTVTPDGKYISCIIQRDNGAQDLGKYPINGGDAEVLINTLKVGYHSWIDKENLLLFVLEDSSRNSLHHFNITSKDDKVIIKNPGRSLHRIPGTSDLSFIDKQDKENWKIMRFNSSNQELSVISATLPGKEDIAWINKDLIIMSNGTQLFFRDLKNGKEWQPVTINNTSIELKGITRLAVNMQIGKLSMVVAE